MSDTSPRKSVTDSNDSTAVERRRKAHKKVKTGCKSCKVRHEKCDEQKPKCSGCMRHSTECSYAPIAVNRSQRTLRAARAQEPRHSPATNTTSSGLSTPRSNPRASPSPDVNFEDLELLHQYITSTCVATSQLPERTTHIQNTIPPLAQKYPFLMHGILGNAAVHMSWLHPARKSHYTVLAARHHSVALPEFQQAMQNLTQDNYSAVIMYSKGLVWCSFAHFDTFSSNQKETDRDRADRDWLPKWFHLLRGSCVIAEYCTPWSGNNNGLPLLPMMDDTAKFRDSLDNRRLSALFSQLLPLTDSPFCEPVLSNLQEAFARASMKHHNTPIRNAMNYWTGKMPNEFVEALRKKEPWALVIMAHLCILVFRSETRWFMRGNAAELLRLVTERLPEPWEPFLQWPREEIELSNFGEQ